MKGFEKKVLANIWPEIKFENVSESIAIDSKFKFETNNTKNKRFENFEFVDLKVSRRPFNT